MRQAKVLLSALLVGLWPFASEAMAQDGSITGRITAGGAPEIGRAHV